VAGDKSVTIFANLTIEDEKPKKGHIYFWTGITKRKSTDKEKSQFLNEYTGEPIPWDPNLWPGPVVGDGCTMIRGPFLVKIIFLVNLKTLNVAVTRYLFYDRMKQLNFIYGAYGTKLDPLAIIFLENSRCQFHQHFARAFFVRKCFAQLFSSYILAKKSTFV